MNWIKINNPPSIITITVEGEPEYKHIIKSCTKGYYLIVDDSPFWPGKTEMLTKEQIKEMYKIDIE